MNVLADALEFSCFSISILTLMVTEKHGYTGKSEITSDHRAGKTIVNLAGRLNESEDISPRTGVQIKDLGNNRIICSHPMFVSSH